MTELTKLIRTKSSPGSGKVHDSANFVSFFPDFVWAVRDFMMQLVWDGQPITEDEYLENALKLIPGIRAWPGWWKVQQEVESTQPCHSALAINLYSD